MNEKWSDLEQILSGINCQKCLWVNVCSRRQPTWVDVGSGDTRISKAHAGVYSTDSLKAKGMGQLVLPGHQICISHQRDGYSIYSLLPR